MRLRTPDAKGLFEKARTAIFRAMDLFKASERLMGMKEADWAHHASPWSVYTRFTILPLLVLTVWLRESLGWWIVVPLACIVVWIWANPRVFAKPEHTDNWASKGTFGERIFLNRHAVPVPAHHQTWGIRLSIIAGAGLIPLIWGVVVYDVGLTLLGLTLSMGAKIWFIDRMVWLFEDMKTADPTYESWLS